MTEKPQTSLLGLCAFVFVLMFAIGMASPIVPLYASGLGATWTEIGLMGTSWGTTLMLLAVVTGKLSDRFGRKPLLIASGALSAVAALLYMVSTAVMQVILVRILEGAAWALFWPALEALATEIVEPRAAGRAIGMATASYGVAFATGSLAGGSIVAIYGYYQTFTTYLALSMVSVLVAIFLLRGRSRRQVIKHDQEKRGGSRLLRAQPLLFAYFLGGAYTFGLGIVLTLLSVFAKSVGVVVFLIGMLFGIFWAGRIFGSFGGGRLSDRYGRRPLAVLAMIGNSVGFILVGGSGDVGLLFAGVLILGLCIGAAFPVSVALISDHVSHSKRGYAMGIFETSCATGFMLAATFGGLLSDLYTPRVPYYLAAAVSLLAAGVFAWKRVS